MSPPRPRQIAIAGGGFSGMLAAVNLARLGAAAHAVLRNAIATVAESPRERARGGARSRFLFAIGPLLRGTLWESIAVPEWRGQALRGAQTLLEECHAGALVSTRRDEAGEPAMLEHWI